MEQESTKGDDQYQKLAQNDLKLEREEGVVVGVEDTGDKYVMRLDPKLHKSKSRSKNPPGPHSVFNLAKRDLWLENREQENN